MLWIIDPLASGNRHLDADGRPHSVPPPPPDRVLKGHRRRVNLGELLAGIVVTPWASSSTFDEVNRLVRDHGFAIPVRPSELTRYQALLPERPEAAIPTVRLLP